jgi:uncharacterized protein YjbJ (UPF0337 family)
MAHLKKSALTCVAKRHDAADGNRLAPSNGRTVPINFADAVRNGGRGMNRDEIKGKAEKAKGYIKEETGEALNDPELEAEGRSERASGKLREGFGKAKRKVSDAIEDVADKVDE